MTDVLFCWVGMSAAWL